jgi:hypothetical protein
MMTKRYLFILIVGLLSSTFTIGQQVAKYDLYDLAENRKLQIFNREVKSFSDSSRKGICFNAVENNGVAWLDSQLFSDGIIELDIKGKDVLQKSFVGIAFHGMNEKTFDAIYFRPFNFKAVDSIRRIHAVQYISLPEYDWEKLRNEQNGKYEKAVLSAPNPNDWFHAKIVVKFPTINVYVNDNNEPSLIVSQLNNRKSGKIGLWVGHNSDGCFANFSILAEPKK